MITIIDYGVGNLASLTNAFAKLNLPIQISDDINVIQSSTAVILPGVGAANAAMQSLKINGLDKTLINFAKTGKPVLGICLGMQLLFDFSAEGNVPCLGLLKGQVKRFDDTKVKVPQIGWNNIKINESNPNANLLYKSIADHSYFYFVNSYYCQPDEPEIVLTNSEYDQTFCSSIAYKNIYGFQFHPEKSGTAGLKLLKNFYETISNNSGN